MDNLSDKLVIATLGFPPRSTRVREGVGLAIHATDAILSLQEIKIMGCGLGSISNVWMPIGYWYRKPNEVEWNISDVYQSDVDKFIMLWRDGFLKFNSEDQEILDGIFNHLNFEPVNPYSDITFGMQDYYGDDGHWRFEKDMVNFEIIPDTRLRYMTVEEYLAHIQRQE